MEREKMPDMPLEIERHDIGTMRANDLVMFKHQQDDPNATKYRVLHVITHDDRSPTVWIGPLSLSPSDVQEFQSLRNAKLPLPEKFANCIPVGVRQLVRIPDA